MGACRCKGWQASRTRQLQEVSVVDTLKQRATAATAAREAASAAGASACGARRPAAHAFRG